MPEFKFSGRVSQKKFGASYPQGVRVPPVKNRWPRASNRLNPALAATMMTDAFFTITRHLLELESCLKPLRTREVF